VRPAVDPAPVPERSGAVAFLSSVNRKGDWVLPRNFRVAALLGSVELDLTRARIGPGVSHIEIRSIMGSVEIVVPHHVRIECEGDPIVGSFEVQWKAQSAAAPEDPVVRITGTAIMGSVEVKVVDPNAPGLLEKLRARLSSPKV
jgi:predicted membrane protein